MKTKYFLLIVLVFSIGRIVAQTSNNAGLPGLGSKLRQNQLLKHNLQLQKNNTIANDAGTGWFWQYPKPQGNNLWDIYVFNQDTAIAVGDLSTIIKTTDGGNTWDVKTNVCPAQRLQSVYFVDAKTGWAAGSSPGYTESGKGYLLKTSDGGITWTQVNIDTSFAIYSVYFVDADTGFVFGNKGYLSKTANGGISWVTRNMNDYIGGYLDIFQFNAVAFINKDTGFVVGGGYYGNEIYKTTDCGQSWSWNEQIISPKDLEGLNDICFIDKNYGFIAGMEAFYKTTDGGATWQNKSPNQLGKPSYTSVVFTDSLTGYLIFNGSGYTILKTSDGGNNWVIIDSVTNSLDKFYKVRFSDKGNGWVIGQDGIIYRTTDAGNTWISQREPNHHFNSVYFVDENNGWAVGDSGTILHTLNGGDNWAIQNSANDLFFRSVYAINSQNIVAVGSVLRSDLLPQNAFLLRSVDGGLSWIRQSFDSTVAFNSVIFSNDSTGWITGGDGVVLIKTTNGGNTWDNVYSNSYINLTNIQFINDKIGWVSYYNDSLLMTTNGGKDWTSHLIDSNLGGISFQFVDANTGWAVGDNYMGGKDIYKTLNGGESWYPCESTPNSAYTSIHFINKYIGWAAGAINFNGANGVIIKTTDGGNTWFNQECPSTSTISNLFILDENSGWAVGNGIFKTTDGGGFVSVKEKSNYGGLPKQITLFQNYPNPFNPSTIISWQLAVGSYVTLKIYDMLGREVETLVNNKYYNAGSHSINWNALKMASGVYFYRLQVNSLNNKQDGNFIETKKMILIR